MPAATRCDESLKSVIGVPQIIELSQTILAQKLKENTFGSSRHFEKITTELKKEKQVGPGQLAQFKFKCEQQTLYFVWAPRGHSFTEGKKNIEEREYGLEGPSTEQTGEPRAGLSEKLRQVVRPPKLK